MPDIHFSNRRTSFVVSPARFKRIARAILACTRHAKAGLSITLVGDQAIRRINAEYLGHDYATDVIAFSQLEGPRPKDGPAFLGDVVISIPTARRQAREYGNTLEYEVYYYLCHGILHLIGYDDGTAKEASRMAAKQRQILRKIGIKGEGKNRR